MDNDDDNVVQNNENDEIGIYDIFEISDLQHIQELFSNATGVASVITLPDGTPLTVPSNFTDLCNNVVRKTSKGFKKCKESDAALGKFNPSGPIMRPCLSCGLFDAGASISIEGKHIANWMIGQIRNEILNEQQITKYADEIGADRKAFSEALSKVPQMSIERFQKVAQLLFQMANMLSEKAYIGKKNEMLLERLSISERRYRMLVENSISGVFQTGLDGRIIFANKAALNIVNIKSLTGQLVQTLYSQKEKRDEMLVELIKHGYIENKEIILVRPDKEERTTLISASLCGNEIIGSMVDITSKKQIEAELELKNKQLEISNKEKDKLFSIIAHDLRNPFNSLLTIIDMLNERENLDRDDSKKILLSAKKTAHSVTQLLENLLSWSKSKQGFTPFVSEKLNIFNVVQNTIEQCQKSADNKSIRIEYDATDHVEIFADAKMLETILRNLIINAIKFSYNGGKIYVSNSKIMGGKVYFSVKDFGIGIPGNMKENIFKIDYNACRPGTNGEASSGLGLILCKELVEKHNGRIWVDSKEKEGSTFYFTIDANMTNSKLTV